ncbi:tRNA1(Val) (adenine(37)-N6)-methyltransferase [Ahrensia sp. 13_GOM-1096m]|uniref:tRNA1(Val) (adenine(37)-N6)-methyltransferase n=1 Tax=Ahrensia sp. 13_GOM-1096m TaxID=1380380 RepID=UPI00047CA5C9|nr:methyltransferase [Ahrensia sp. 13_GOM-1096m]
MPVTEFTTDTFHRGKFTLVQPQKGGHRAGIDAMLLAACVADGFDGELADLGSGAGAAGLAVLSRCQQARASLFEMSDTMIDCAQRTLAHSDNENFAARTKIFKADITASGEIRSRCGLVQNSFDWVIANPPFNESDDRRSPHSERSFAHVMDGKTIELWSRTAASIAKPSGYFSIIVRPQSIGEILAGFMGRFGALRITPVHPRMYEDAIRILVTGKKGSKKKLEMTAPLILHNEEGRDFTPRADALINGEQALFDI